MKITEEQLRKIIRESLEKLCEEGNIEEGLFGLSLDNRVKNGHWREKINTKNIVVDTAYSLGWELKKYAGHQGEVFPGDIGYEDPRGKYMAKIMSGYANNVEPDTNIEGVSHPKASWPMLIAMLNKELRPQGYTASGANYREARLDINDNETNDGYGAKTYMGTIIVRKG